MQPCAEGDCAPSHAARAIPADVVFLVERPQLLALAHSRLKSRTDAEDVVQDAWLRWQQHHADVETPAAWLRTVTKNLCLDRLRTRSRSAASLPEDHPAFAGPEFDPAPIDHRVLTESLTVVLRALTPLERVVFVLRECFEWRYAHVARLLGRTEPAVRQLSRRARQHVTQSVRRVDVSAQEVARVVSAFAEAHQTGDVRALVQALAPSRPTGNYSTDDVGSRTHEVAGVVVISRDRLLLGRRGSTLPWYPGVWDLPGSHVGPTEGPINCALRAARDELGIAPCDPRQVAAFAGADYELSVFSVRSWEGRVRNAKPSQHETLSFISREEAQRLPLADPRLLDLYEHAAVD